MRRMTHAALAAGGLMAALALSAVPAGAAVFNYTVTLNELNGSGVSGFGTLNLDTSTSLLSVNLSATGLDEGTHAKHIHGRFDSAGSPMDSVTPTSADDADGDGFIEVLEGVGAYGDVLLSLLSPPGAGGSFPTVGADGVLNFSEVYDLADSATFTPSPATGTVYAMADLLPLELREIVIHGGNVPDGAGAGTGGEVNGTGGFIPILPVAAGEIQFASVPEPGVLGLLGLGLGALALRRFTTTPRT